jgi:putative FmdB family regulatory protein
MPSYDFKCSKCQYIFERFKPINSSSREICPKCGGRAVRMLSCGTGLIFKGSGFYTTDHRSADYKRQKSAEKEKIGSGSSTKKELKEEN